MTIIIYDPLFHGFCTRRLKCFFCFKHNMILTFKACVHIARCKYDLVWGWEAGESSAQCAGRIISPAQPSFWATSIQTPDINLGHKHHRKYWIDTHNRLYWPNQIFLSVPCNLCCKKPSVYYLWLILYLFSPMFCFTALNPGTLVSICLKLKVDIPVTIASQYYQFLFTRIAQA